ncbi:MAG: 3-phosphoshikimate 1-carboxyvinyltransferase, partial [Clostridia bacterium]
MTIFPAESVSGTLFVPGDKSISHRAIIFAALSDGVCKIHKYLNCDDCRATISCLNKLGVATDTAADTLYVHGVGMHGLKSPGGVLYTANSGTTTRLLTGLLSAQNFNSIIDGDASIRKRPMARVIAPLIEMGAHIKSRIGGLCPIEIRPSSLSAIRYTLPVASAQLKSALILAGLYAHGESIIKTPRVCRTHTEHMLKHLGANVSDDGDVICISKTENIQPFELSVPADISSAAFFIVAALILPNSRLTLKNVGINSSRTGVLDVLRNMG